MYRRLPQAPLPIGVRLTVTLPDFTAHLQRFYTLEVLERVTKKWMPTYFHTLYLTLRRVSRRQKYTAAQR